MGGGKKSMKVLESRAVEHVRSPSLSILLYLCLGFLTAGCGSDPSSLERLYGSAGPIFCQTVSRYWNRALVRHIKATELDSEKLYKDTLRNVLHDEKSKLLQIFPQNASHIQPRFEELNRQIENTSSTQGLETCEDLMSLDKFYSDELALEYTSQIQRASSLEIENYPSIFHQFLDTLGRQLDYFSGLSFGRAHLSTDYAFGFSLAITTESLSKKMASEIPVFGVQGTSHPLRATDRIVAITPPAEAPPSQADLVPMEKLLKEKWGLEKLTGWIEAPEHPYIGALIRRSPTSATEFIQLRARNEWKPPLVAGDIYNGAIVIKIREMSEGVSREFFDQLNNLSAVVPSDSPLIIDVRWNPGGGLEEYQKIAGVFLGNQILGTIYGAQNRLEPDQAIGPSLLSSSSRKIAVLINHRTASAAELLAASLQSMGRGILIGQRSFGKAIGQEVSVVAELHALFRLTTMVFFDARGESYQGKGLMPDIEISDKIADACAPDCIQRMENLPRTQTIDVPKVAAPTHMLTTSLDMRRSFLEEFTSDKIKSLQNDPLVTQASDSILEAAVIALKRLP